MVRGAGSVDLDMADCASLHWARDGMYAARFACLPVLVPVAANVSRAERTGHVTEANGKRRLGR